MSDCQNVDWQRYRQSKVREGICPDSGLPLQDEGEGLPGTKSCSVCDCFGYDASEVGPQPKSPLSLLERIVFAALSVIEDADPVINVAIGKGEVHITWN